MKRRDFLKLCGISLVIPATMKAVPKSKTTIMDLPKYEPEFPERPFCVRARISEFYGEDLPFYKY